MFSLAKLKQKKYRQSEKQVVIEGRRIIEQLLNWGIRAEELYISEYSFALPAKSVYLANSVAMQRICDSDSPPQIAGLYSIPEETYAKFKSAFYLDGISDPGNLGTIFRIASAFGIESLLLSPGCCEVASPKVIRSSLGAVYKVPFRTCTATELKAMETKVIALDMAGKQSLRDYSPDDTPYVMAIGSEAHGLSQDVTAIATLSLRIDMPGDMESLNAAVCAGICAYQISR